MSKKGTPRAPCAGWVSPGLRARLLRVNRLRSSLDRTTRAPCAGRARLGLRAMEEVADGTGYRRGTATGCCRRVASGATTSAAALALFRDRCCCRRSSGRGCSCCCRQGAGCDCDGKPLHVCGSYTAAAALASSGCVARSDQTYTQHTRIAHTQQNRTAHIRTYSTHAQHTCRLGPPSRCRRDKPPHVNGLLLMY